MKAQNQKKNLNLILETSTLTPLLYNSPYTEKIIKYLQKEINDYDCKIFIQRDCLREARGFFRTPIYNQFRDCPVYRIDKLLNDGLIDNRNYKQCDAYSILIGGHITPLSNHNRFQAFFYGDLIFNAVDYTNLKDMIDERRNNYYSHLNPDQVSISLNTRNIINGWGSFYKKNTIDLVLCLNLFSDDYIDEFSNNQILINGQHQTIIDAVDANDGSLWNYQFTYNQTTRTFNRDKYHYWNAFYFNASNKTKGDWKIVTADSGFKKNSTNPDYFPIQTNIFDSKSYKNINR